MNGSCIDDVTAMHLAALRGELDVLRKHAPLHANVATPEGHTALSLAASAGMIDACRLLLREGATVDAADNSGVTALMHACMHGNAALVDLLLLHGASPHAKKQEGGQTAISLAAQYGRPAALGALFRADAALVEAVDGHGRTALHWGVVSQHTPSVKYLLGKWNADVRAVDKDGNTPLHLVKSDHAILLYLVHGTSVRPHLRALNGVGETPAMCAAREGAHDVAEALGLNSGPKIGGDELDYGALGYVRGERSLDPRMFAFMASSPVREIPASSAPAPWPLRATWKHLLVASMPPLPYLLLACGAPVGTALWLSAALISAGALVILCTSRSYASYKPGPPVPFMAPLLVGLVLAAGLMHVAAFLPSAVPSAIGAAALPAYIFFVPYAGYWAQWARVVCTEPGFVKGADPEHAERYWRGYEKMPVGSMSPSGFCERSELVLPPRAAYSKLCQGAIRCFDHDCPWVGTALGVNNHPNFLGMLLCGEFAVLLWGCTMYACGAPAPFRSWPAAFLHNLPRPLGGDLLETRVDQLDQLEVSLGRVWLVMGGVPLVLFLLLMLTPLLAMHVYLASFNLTTREQVVWLRRAGTSHPPTPPLWGHRRSQEWAEYAPYDRGPFANLRLFLRGQRDEPPAAAKTDTSPLRRSTRTRPQGLKGEGDDSEGESSV